MTELIKEEIYLVDDDTMITESLASNLSHEYDVKTFNSAADALEHLTRSVHPKVIISDLRMPDIDGFGFTERLKANNVASKLILASGYAQKNDAIKAIDLGIFALLEKPFSISQLHEVVARATEKVSAYDRHFALVKNLRDLTDRLSALTGVYYDRIIILEDTAFDHELAMVSGSEDLARYLKCLTDERKLIRQIEVISEQLNALDLNAQSVA